MTYCVVQINCLPLPRFFKEVTMKTAEERYEETWNSYLELLNKDPRASLVSFTKLKSVSKGCIRSSCCSLSTDRVVWIC